MCKRMNTKTLETFMQNHFIKRYQFSPVVSEAIAHDTIALKRMLHDTSRHDGQILFSAVSNSEPAGKALKDCQFQRVVLTMYAKSDLAFKEQYGTKELRLRIMKRICEQAVIQGACLSHEDLAHLLHCDRSTISAYQKIFAQRNEVVQTRASFTDQSRRVTHKEQIIKLFLLNVRDSEIAHRTRHNLTSVEAYIKDFLRITLLHTEGKNQAAICQLLSHSPLLIREYVCLYKALKNDHTYAEILEQKLLMYRANMLLDVKDFNTSPFKKKRLLEVAV